MNKFIENKQNSEFYIDVNGSLNFLAQFTVNSYNFYVKNIQGFVSRKGIDPSYFLITEKKLGLRFKDDAIFFFRDKQTMFSNDIL